VVELIVPAARDGVAKEILVKACQCGARLASGAGLARFGLGDPRLGHLGLRPQALCMPPDTALGVALVNQATSGRVAVAQSRLEQFGARMPRRAACNSFKALQEPDPFRLVSGFDADRLNLGPVLFEIFSKDAFLLVVEVDEKQSEKVTGAFWKTASFVASKRRSSLRTSACAEFGAAASLPCILP
jgi:hypothetical protein